MEHSTLRQISTLVDSKVFLLISIDQLFSSFSSLSFLSMQCFHPSSWTHHCYHTLQCDGSIIIFLNIFLIDLNYLLLSLKLDHFRIWGCKTLLYWWKCAFLINKNVLPLVKYILINNMSRWIAFHSSALTSKLLGLHWN